MQTWQIMVGLQLLSVIISVFAVVRFMLKEEPLDMDKNESAEDRIKN